MPTKTVASGLSVSHLARPSALTRLFGPGSAQRSGQTGASHAAASELMSRVVFHVV